MNKESSISPLSRFWLLIKPDQKDIKNVYVYSIFYGIISLSLPLGIQTIVNLIQGGQVNTAWIVLVILVVLGVAFSGVLQVFQMRIMENLQQKIFVRAAFEFAYRIPRIKMEELYRYYAPELMNRFFDTITLQKGVSKILVDFSSAVLQVLLGLMLLSLYHSFFLFFGVVLAIVAFLIIRFTARKGLQTSLEESKNKYKLVQWLEELARASAVFKLAGKSELPLKRVDMQVDKYLLARENHFRVLVNQYALMIFFKVIVVTGLLAIGGILVMEQQMNIGQFVAAEIIILMLMSSVEKLIGSLETIYDVFTALEKIAQVTDLELESEEGIDLCKTCNEKGLTVEMSAVSFRYPDDSEGAIENVSLLIHPAERVSISGGDGSERSTVLHLMAGLFKVKDGRIFYNGVPANTIQPESFRNVIGCSFSEDTLFEGTLAENITLGREGISETEVTRLIQILKLEQFVKSLQNGLQTVVTHHNRRLPQSVVQKILLARAIVKQPKLLILENSFDSIDPAERREIIDFITSPQQNWTIIAATSDLYLLDKCSRNLRMEGGKITDLSPRI